jgi:hypothetical protein
MVSAAVSGSWPLAACFWLLVKEAKNRTPMTRRHLPAAGGLKQEASDQWQEASSQLLFHK